MNKAFDLRIFSPLALLLSLLFIPTVETFLSGSAEHPNVAAFRYFAIPISGLSIAGVLFLWTLKWNKLSINISALLEQKARKVAIVLGTCFFLYSWIFSCFRYLTFHTSVIDLGSFENKIWRISASSSIWEAAVTSATGHFQPVMLIYGLFYKFYDSIILIQAVQGITVTVAAIPLYLISRDVLKSNLAALLIIFLYFLYPAVEFQSIMEFHPDHVYICFLMYAYYYAEKERYKTMLAFVSLAAMSKETFLLGAAFFGLYLVSARNQKLIGLTVLIISICIFFGVVLYLEPSIDPYLAGKNIFQIGTGFSHLAPDSQSWLSSLYKVIEGVAQYREKKVFFIIFLLMPVLFLPLIQWKRFLPALPLLLIPIISSYPLHIGIDSHYTVGVIPPLFFALVFALSDITKRYGESVTTALLACIITMSLTLNIAHSPSIISVNFWNHQWSEIWHNSIYKATKHEALLERVILDIPTDPYVKVASQNYVNHARLAHRWQYWVFPDTSVNELWAADYILLDLSKPHHVRDKVDSATYMEILGRIRRSPQYLLLTETEDILLFKKKN